MKTQELCNNIIELLKYYISQLQPVYSYLVSLKDKKPLQVLVEVENTFAHIAQACQEPETSSTNLERAKNHLTRLETDLYKLLLVELKRRLEIDKHNIREIIKLSKIARDTELNEIGSNIDGHKRVIDAYRKAIDSAITLLKLPPLFD